MSLWIAMTLAVCADPARCSPTSVLSAKVVPAPAAVRSPIQMSGQWRFLKTPNFRIWGSISESQMHRLADACEAMRTELRAAWLAEKNDTEKNDTEHQDAAWTPACDVVVHATIAEYVRQLGPGSEQTSGCSSIELDSGRVVVRRIDLRADGAAWLTESLPHELTHVVLADRFSTRQISRWADEGMAILAEPLSKQAHRARDFHLALQSRSVFRVADLLSLNSYPPPHLRPAFYGQSTALVKFLVDRGTPEQFVRFVEQGMRHGHDRALRDVYGIQGVSHLDQLWQRRLNAPAAAEPSVSLAFSRRIAEIISPPELAGSADRLPAIAHAGR